MTGKPYANRKKLEDRPKGDFYSTPKSLIWVAEDIIKKEFSGRYVFEPACGKRAISAELEKLGFKVFDNDLYAEGVNNQDYLKLDKSYMDQQNIITNPPFSLWDDFVIKAKSHCDKFMFIGRLNYLGTAGRNKSGIWDGLKAIYPFNRYVDYQTPYREDGLFHVGAMATAWFLWEKKYTEDPIIKILDVQPWAKLGQFKQKTHNPSRTRRI